MSADLKVVALGGGHGLAACTGVKETPKLTASASETANALRDFLLRIFLLNSSNLPLRGVRQWFI